MTPCASLKDILVKSRLEALKKVQIKKRKLLNSMRDQYLSDYEFSVQQKRLDSKKSENQVQNCSLNASIGSGSAEINSEGLVQTGSIYQNVFKSDSKDEQVKSLEIIRPKCKKVHSKIKYKSQFKLKKFLFSVGKHQPKSTEEQTSLSKFKCDQCDKSFCENSRLENHMNVHCERFVRQCCAKTFHSKYDFNFHFKCMHKNYLLRFRCQYEECGSVFSNKNDVLVHMSMQHFGAKVSLMPSYECRFCKTEFTKHKRAKIHSFSCFSRVKNVISPQPYIRSGWPVTGFKLLGGAPRTIMEPLDEPSDPYSFDENNDGAVIKTYEYVRQVSSKEFCNQLVIEIANKAFDLGRESRLESIFDDVLSAQSSGEKLSTPGKENKLKRIFEMAIANPEHDGVKSKKSLEDIFEKVLKDAKLVKDIPAPKD